VLIPRAEPRVGGGMLLDWIDTRDEADGMLDSMLPTEDSLLGLGMLARDVLGVLSCAILMSMIGKVVLDEGNARALLGIGWMLLLVSTSPKGCLSTGWISSLDIVMAISVPLNEELTAYLSYQTSCRYDLLPPLVTSLVLVSCVGTATVSLGPLSAESE
jgi:hypothetical protein